MSSKPFSLGEKPAWSETSAQKCHLTQQLAHASPGVLRRPLPMSRSRRVPGFAGWRERARALILASSGRSLPPTGFTTPSCLRICLCPSAAAVHPGRPRTGFLGGSGPAGASAALAAGGDGGSIPRFLPAASAQQQPWRRTQPPCLL